MSLSALARSLNKILRTARTVTTGEEYFTQAVFPPKPSSTSIQGGQACRRLSFVDSDLDIPLLLPSWYARSARSPPAQAELHRLSKVPDIGKRNLGLRCAWPPCSVDKVGSRYLHLCSDRANAAVERM